MPPEFASVLRTHFNCSVLRGSVSNPACTASTQVPALTFGALSLVLSRPHSRLTNPYV